MGIQRRGVLLAGLGLLVGGCVQRSRTTPPGAHWPTVYVPPAPGSTTPPVVVAPPVGPTPPVAPPVAPQVTPAPLAGVSVIGRQSWTVTPAMTARVNPMNGIRRITVHHEGWTPVPFADAAATAERIEQIRRIHVRDRQWGDIGYHLIVDRAGRVWEGRQIAYQGAHVRNHNEHNLGILVLGNFDQQALTQAQATALAQTLSGLQRQFRVPVGQIYTHQELMASACPGRRLQAQMNQLRRSGALT